MLLRVFNSYNYLSLGGTPGCGIYRPDAADAAADVAGAADAASSAQAAPPSTHTGNIAASMMLLLLYGRAIVYHKR